MKFMVLGADGMVGSGIVRALGYRHEVVGITRTLCEVGRLGGFQSAIKATAPDVIVNCIGVVPQRTNDAEAMIECNALFPHQLRRIWPGGLIHISTDCVFDKTVYGRTKLLGEVGMTLRCCVVGFSAKRKVSFLDWFVFCSPAVVDGWRNAYFSPITNLELARAVESAAANYAEGVFDVAGARLSKYEYLHLVNAEFSLGKTIRPVDDPKIDKSSTSETFAARTGWEPHSNVAQVRELRAHGERHLAVLAAASGRGSFLRAPGPALLRLGHGADRGG